MDYKIILNQIEEIQIEDLEDTRVKLEDMINIHYSLTLDNPMTYIIFLTKRLDLTKDERNDIIQIIKKLEHNERVKFEYYSKSMHDYISIEPIQDEQFIMEI